MRQDVEIRPEGKFRRIFPSLKPLSVDQKMGRLPEVVGLVTVGDDGPEGSRQTDCQDELEGGVA